MNIHSHDIQKAAPACCPIPNTRIGQTHSSVDWTHVHYADFQKSTQPRRVCSLRKNASHLRQSETNDDDFAVAQFSGSSSCHDFRREHFGHFCSPAPIGLKFKGVEPIRSRAISASEIPALGNHS